MRDVVYRDESDAKACAEHLGFGFHQDVSADAAALAAFCAEEGWDGPDIIHKPRCVELVSALRGACRAFPALSA